MSDELIIDGAVLQVVLRSPDGMVGRDIMARAQRVQMGAKRQAPRRTGCLQDTIVKRYVTVNGSFAVMIQSDTTPCSPTRQSYSEIIHNGRGEVRPVTAHALRWMGVGGPVFSMKSKAVKPNRFLSDNLRLAL
jgi:hypothetical protein